MAERVKLATTLTVAQRKQCLALGATFSEVANLCAEGLEFEEILDLCQTAQQAKLSEKDAQAAAQIRAQRDAEELKNLNKPNPGKSAYSYPEGDLVRSREGILPHQVFYLGMPVGTDVSTAEELELFAQIQPGEYVCTKTDDSKFPVKAEAQRDPAGRLTRIVITWNATARNKDNAPKLKDMLREIIAQQSALVPA